MAHLSQSNVQHCVSLQINSICWTLWAGERDIIQTDSCSETQWLSCERRCTVCLCVSLCRSAVLLVRVYMSWCWQHNVSVCQLDWGSAELAALSSPTLFSDSSYFLFPRVTMSSTSSAKSRLPLSTSALISRCTAPGPAPCCSLTQWKSIANTWAPKSLTKQTQGDFSFITITTTATITVNKMIWSVWILSIKVYRDIINKIKYII